MKVTGRKGPRTVYSGRRPSVKDNTRPKKPLIQSLDPDSALGTGFLAQGFLKSAAAVTGESLFQAV